MNAFDALHLHPVNYFGLPQKARTRMGNDNGALSQSTPGISIIDVWSDKNSMYRSFQTLNPLHTVSFV